MNIHSFDIRDGKSEAELWENFGHIYEQLEEGDLVYLDITHAFRSLPLIATAILDYAVTLKDIKIGGVYYCAYDARTQTGDEVYIPIFDLTSFVTLSSMSFGANTLTKKGDAKYFEESLNQVLTPIPAGKGKNFLIKELKKLPRLYTSFFTALNNSDLFNINRALVNIKDCFDKIEELKDQLYLNEDDDLKHPQLLPYLKLIETTADMFGGFMSINKQNKSDRYFSDPEVKKAFVANTDILIEMAMTFGLYQQAATMFIENLISRVVCQVDGSLFNRELRDKANEFLYANAPKQKSSDKELIDHFPHLKNLPINQKISRYKDSVGDIRNIMNHANMSLASGNKPIDTARLESLFHEYLQAIQELD